MYLPLNIKRALIWHCSIENYFEFDGNFINMSFNHASKIFKEGFQFPLDQTTNFGEMSL